MPFSVISPYFKCQLWSEKWQLICLHMFHYLYWDQTLAAKSFEKTDTKVNDIFFSFSPILNAG